MRRGLALLFFLTAFAAQAHLGNPDVFFDGSVGPYPARITIRMPTVVPGRAEIIVHVQIGEPVETSFLPLYSSTAVTNAPAPDVGHPVPGESGLYIGDLWLMSFGAYSVEVQIKGPQGSGVVQIPVTSVALRQLPLPSFLGKLLVALTAVLVLGGIGIAAAAWREAALAPAAAPDRRDRRNGFIAAGTVTLVFVVALAGGRFWWKVEENTFRRHLREGAWPDLAPEVRAAGGDRVLRLEVGKELFRDNSQLSLLPDHGKLMHLFMVKADNRDAFAHLHPVRLDREAFEVTLPPLPEGRYLIFCDLTFEGGASSTATNSVVLPALVARAETNSSAPAPARDPDDSWASHTPDPMLSAPGTNLVCELPGGLKVAWDRAGALRARHDAFLRFTVSDATGQPVALDPYMGMLCHAAVLRADNTVFAHLHPAGNFSMAAQSFFETKLETEKAASTTDAAMTAAEDHSMHHHHGGPAVSSVYLPYEFPGPGDYRLWVQFKIDGRVLTAVFDAHVS